MATIKDLTPEDVRRINSETANVWRHCLLECSGSDIIVRKFDKLPFGQVWVVEGSSAWGNTHVSSEIISFTFRRGRYQNPNFDTEQFYSINNRLANELADFMTDTPIFDGLRRKLAAEAAKVKVQKGRVWGHGCEIWSRTKDIRGTGRGFSC